MTRRPLLKHWKVEVDYRLIRLVKSLMCLSGLDFDYRFYRCYIYSEFVGGLLVVVVGEAMYYGWIDDLHLFLDCS